MIKKVIAKFEEKELGFIKLTWQEVKTTFLCPYLQGKSSDGYKLPCGHLVDKKQVRIAIIKARSDVKCPCCRNVVFKKTQKPNGDDLINNMSPEKVKLVNEYRNSLPSVMLELVRGEVIDKLRDLNFLDKKADNLVGNIICGDQEFISNNKSLINQWIQTLYSQVYTNYVDAVEHEMNQHIYDRFFKVLSQKFGDSEIDILAVETIISETQNYISVGLPDILDTELGKRQFPQLLKQKIKQWLNQRYTSSLT